MPDRREEERVGLCIRCKNASVVKSDKGSIFYLCELSTTDPLFPKYPRLPVLTCPGFDPNKSGQDSV